MHYLLDTNTMARIFRREAEVVHRLLATPRRDVFLPEVVFAEMAYGVERLGSTKKAKKIRAFIASVRSEFQIAPWGSDVSFEFGRIKAKLERGGQRVEDFDVAIAAHAVALDGTLITSNRKHFARIEGLRLEDWA